MTIREYLSQGEPLLFDGAMGTYYAAHSAGRCELSNLERPEEIAAIHNAYLDAGSRAIKSNTFSVGSDFADANYTLGDKLIRAGYDIAAECAAAHDAFVFADLGPVPESCGIPANKLFQMQAKSFLDAGAMHFLLETLPNDKGIADFARWLKEHCPEAFLLVSFAVDPQGLTAEGLSGRILFQKTAALPEVDAVGFNCMSGPNHLLHFIRSLDIGNALLSVMPNAGYPTVLGRRIVYQSQADYFGEQAARIVSAGASIIGGCCGTTPEHIAATAYALKTKPVFPAAAGTVPQRPSVPSDNVLWEKLSSGKRIAAVELDPPADDNIAPFLEGVQTLWGAGADAITIADCPIGRPRADSSLLACKIKRELDVEPLPHMTCRDRNLNAVKALLLGLSMDGVHNVLLVTGDPIPTADRDEVKSVFNFNSRKLIRYVRELNETVLQTPFRIFAALNLNARNFDVQLRLAQEKESNGASGFLTQPVHSKEALENLKLARETLHGKLLGGVFPIVSYRNACFLNNEITGFHICEEIVQLYDGLDRAAAEDMAVRISSQVMREMSTFVDGYYLMTPFRRIELMARILSEAKPFL